MAAGSLLTLLDDIATVLDDVAVLSKVAAKKTAGVLGDDLALNAEQVSGVKAQRELPVVWAVAKGSFVNKLILVPAALLISAFVPVLITYLLILGGLYLCFEGTEKLAHKWFSSKEQLAQEHAKLTAALSDPNVDLRDIEQDKIKGAIRTDFVLSAEIVVIILGTLQTQSIGTQVAVLSFMAVLFTVGVYGFVALIVKIDDLGLYLLRNSLSTNFASMQRSLGRALLRFAPILMKTLTIVGTAAMFLVGGGIISHGVPFVHHLVEQGVAQSANLYPSVGHFVGTLTSISLNGVVGILAGIAVWLVVSAYQKVKA